MPDEAVRMYVGVRTGNDAEKGNEGLYRGLLKILKMSGTDFPVQEKKDGTQRRIVLW